MSSRLPFIYIMHTPERGRGVFTAQEITEGTPIESCPALLLSAEDTATIHKTSLHDYYFLWGTEGQSAIALGFGSIYNHSSQANADYFMDTEGTCIEIIATREIQAGEEITLNYMEGGEQRSTLWFEEQ